ncbi:MAG: hypothetical protein ABIG44_01085 [Planctomycetota bacterium]
MKKSKWLTFSMMLASGAMLFQSGCLGSFWQGVTRGWPSDNPWINLAVDVANEVVFG